MTWIKLIITKVENQVDDLIEFLESFAEVLSISLMDSQDQPLFQQAPDHMPLWSKTQLEILLSAESEAHNLIAAIQKRWAESFSYSIQFLEDQDWVRLTQQQFQAECFANRIWICPSWQDASALSGTVVKIDPGLAFGTGSHPTTALCLEWLAEQNLTSKTIVDYGCGSGILSLAALGLGAQEVWAIDHDAQALEATENNYQLNHFANAASLHIITPEACPDLSADIVIANILSNPLCELATLLQNLTALEGYLVLSGLLEEEINLIIQAYQPQCQLVDVVLKEGWARIILRKISSNDCTH